MEARSNTAHTGAILRILKAAKLTIVRIQSLLNRAAVFESIFTQGIQK